MLYCTLRSRAALHVAVLQTTRVRPGRPEASVLDELPCCGSRCALVPTRVALYSEFAASLLHGSGLDPLLS